MRLTLDTNLVLFGTSDNITTDRAFDFILLFAKFYIYKCKLQSTVPTLVTFLLQLKLRSNLEIITNQKINTVWYPYKAMFVS